MKKTRKENLSQYVKRVIKQKGLRLMDVEINSGGKISNGYVSGIMQGKITNLTLEKIAALARGLGVDGKEIFEAAYSPINSPPTDSASADLPDVLSALELMQKLVLNPTLLTILEEALSLLPDQQKSVLKSLRRIAKSKKDSEPNSNHES